MTTAIVGLFAAFVASGLCLIIHLEGLRYLLWAVQHRDRPVSHPLLVMLFGIFALHLFEVLVYAVVLSILELTGYGSLDGATESGVEWFIDHFYFSIASYTTLGLGDIVPHGAIRLVAGIEALNGLLLVAWSASMTYLVVERLWSDRLSQIRGRGPKA